MNNASKVHTALKLSQDDQQTITTLRSEVEKAWKMVDTAQSKETSAKETITSLKEEIANLSGLVEKSAALTGCVRSACFSLCVTGGRGQTHTRMDARHVGCYGCSDTRDTSLHRQLWEQVSLP